MSSSSSSSAKSIGSSMPPPLTVGRYVLHAPIARGGMATIYIARLTGAEGFSRLVAAKRLHPQLTEDPDVVAMFRDEARIASKIHHANVVPVLDVVLAGQELIIVQEYVHGVPLDKLFKTAIGREADPTPVPIAVGVVAGVLAGLHAAHQTCDELGEPLHIVHRDVSPQNVIVSMDGSPRLLDFGIAKARSSVHHTREGFFKGKVAYMAPEQLRAEDATPASDVYAVGVILWELLANRRLHSGRSDAELFHTILSGHIPLLTVALEDARAWLPAGRWEQLVRLEPVVARALALCPEDRYATAAEMMDALLAACAPASAGEVAQWVRDLGGEYLDKRQTVLQSSEESWRSQSKIAVAAAMAASESPESLIKLVARPDASADGSMSSQSPVSLSARAPLFYADPPPTPKRNMAPWIATAVLLVLIGVLLGLISARRAPPELATAPPPTVTAIPIAASAPAASPNAASAPSAAPSAKTADPPPVLAPPPKPSHVAPAPPPTTRWTAPSKGAVAAPPAHAATSASQPHTVAPAPPPPPSAPPAASPPKNDCDPPFYFEGTKKIFKPNCL